MTETHVSTRMQPFPTKSVGLEPPSDVFILVGCVRSGTTLLRLMLDHHPQMSCLLDSEFMVDHYAKCAAAVPAQYQRRIARDWHYSQSGLHFPENAKTYGDVMASFIEQRRQTTGKPIVGATIHRRFENLPIIFPDAKYVHLIRDGRPVASSIAQMGWVGNLYVGAHHWRQTLEDIENLRVVVPHDRWFELQYEHLLSDVPGKLAKICTFIGVPHSDSMLRYSDNSTYDPPDPANAQRWRTKLSPYEIYLAEMAAGDMLGNHGYTRMFPPARPSLLERLVLRIDNRIRRTIFRCRRFGTYLLVARKLGRLVGICKPSLERRYQAIQEAHIR